MKKRKTIAYPLSISLLPISFPLFQPRHTVLSLTPDLSSLSSCPLSPRLEPFRNRESLPYERQMNIHAPAPLSPSDISGNQLTRANGRSHKAVSDVFGKKMRACNGTARESSWRNRQRALSMNYLATPLITNDGSVDVHRRPWRCRQNGKKKNDRSTVFTLHSLKCVIA